MKLQGIETNITLTNQKLQFTGVSKANPDRPIVFDFVPPMGDGRGYRGLELIMMSLSGCISTALVVLLRKMGKNIDEFSLNAQEVPGDVPFSLQKIKIKVVIKAQDISDSEMQSVIKQVGEMSPVWKLLKDKIDVTLDYKLC